MSNKIKVGIIGGAGYTAGELIRLLVNHPAATINFVHSKSNAGNLLSKVHDDLLGQTAIAFTDSTNFLNDSSIDVLFLCMGHGESKAFLETNEISASVKIIDLSQDFRLQANSKLGERQFVYGLPELNKQEIKTAKNIANPGCFATGIQLGLLPMAKAGLLKDAYITGITGSTGAGQSLSASTHFSWRTNNVQAYKTLTHQHMGEVFQSMHQLQKDFSAAPDGKGINFVPWRGDFARGIFCSAQTHCESSLNELIDLYQDFYKDQPFVTVSEEPIHLKQVVNTNRCNIQLEKAESVLVVHSIIDNLLKGASGQAVQNMNLMFGIDEEAGLKLKASYF
ncbi:MAG TPA: N-acetyl-gamma-glutamyl-phosphate reductase [Ferruginibacter sp.]|nr:N-acetyl-gamma-glutamyl-phosphate reductase [Ferruginibacter sp.]